MKIALTFDIERDLPNVLDTYFGVEIGLLKILEILENFNVKGTFFCTGNVVEHLPEFIRLIEQKGHEIACHGLHHERLNQLDFDKCQDVIYQNKNILEETCQNSEILGFRAPYLKPPKFLFEILGSLGFRYDSSITTPKKLSHYKSENNKIQEFHPSKYSIYLRLPYPFLKRKIFKTNLLILYFHPCEAINMKKLIRKHTNKVETLKNILFRLDRWLHTGNTFLETLRDFIEENLAKSVEFITLKQLLA
ncbi:MAG: polysaccharide deacetylase family protein [Candidatus Hodarchaeota archaeon]